MKEHYFDPRVQENLRKVVQGVTQTVLTHEIILFGSYAYGTPRWDSDVDIMVITSIPNTNTSEWHSRIGSSFYQEVNMPIELVVYPFDLFEERARKFAFEQTVRNHGVSIYRRGIERDYRVV